MIPLAGAHQDTLKLSLSDAQDIRQILFEHLLGFLTAFFGHMLFGDWEMERIVH